jgi:iron complex outermembrane receptor protein
MKKSNKYRSTTEHRRSGRMVLLPSLLAAAVANAQTAAPDDDNLQEVVVTGSRIIQSSANSQQPVSIIDRADIDRTGLASVGELLQQVTAGGKALNAKFNSSGNFGYPADGGGIGAGSAQVDLRNLGSKRVLVLVDGIRWVNESSASGVSGAADLNTIPMSIIDRIEVLEDGASAIYGSDAIAGVVNIITRKTFEGVELNAYRGEYELGGPTTDASITLGGSGERFSGLFVASYYEQEGIDSGEWEQSAFPQPLAGLSAGSSGIPQGRFVFCDPARPASTYGSCTTPDDFYDLTLDNGTATPVWNPADPSAGTYHDFGGADRFNYAPYNLLLTPSKRKAMFARMNFELSDSVSIYAKGLFNNRQSTNRAAPEPIFVGPNAGTGGLADTIRISALNPFNPFGIDLDPASNFGVITRRPVEVGPRLFEQDVDTWYFNLGLEGTFGSDSRFHWDVNYATSENNADQVFRNGYNIGKIQIALGDPAICATIPGCTPLDLFGGQGRPFTQQMIDYIRTTQIDSSKQTLQLLSANVTGDLFDIGDRTAGFAMGAEHRKYEGEFQPDPLRATGESQDSFASPVSADYDVNELYAEFSFPLLESLDASAAVRWSDYSTFGSETTGKVGMRWQPVQAIAFRGTYSTGFRAPNLGELFGLTQFAATLTDPCGPTGVPPVVFDGDGQDTTPLETACRAQGVQSGFEQANTQITTFTGGNAELQPEKSDSFTVGIVHDATWAEGFAERLTFELTYYSHEIESGIQARDLAALLGACLAGGGTDATLCSPFTRAASGNLNPPNNFLDNLGSIETDGFDFKVDWLGSEMSWGHLSAGLQATRVNDFTATDTDGIVSQRTVGIEVSDSAIPKLQANLQLGWGKGSWEVSFMTRYIDAVNEFCGNALTTAVPGCNSTPGETFHELGSAIYNDAQVAWTKAFGMDDFKLSLGVNNIFGEDPPICYSCSLNGYDAGTYDLPGSFWAVTAKYGF